MDMQLVYDGYGWKIKYLGPKYIDGVGNVKLEEIGGSDKLTVGELRVKRVLNSPLAPFAKAIAKAHGITLKSIMADVRNKHVVLARWHLWWLARKHTSVSVNRIAFLTSRDHSTVLYGLGKMDEIMEGAHAHVPEVKI